MRRPVGRSTNSKRSAVTATPCCGWRFPSAIPPGLERNPPMTTVPPPLTNGTPAVQTFALTRLYGSMIALNALDLTVNRGDLFGFIGSNGAGKTTTLRILATFLAPSSGKAEVLGHDVVRDADEVRDTSGYMATLCTVYTEL